MIGVVIYLEDKWNYTQSDRDIDILQMYQETLAAFGVDKLFIIDKTTNGIVHRTFRLDLPQVIYKSLSEILSEYPNHIKIYFEHKNAIPNNIEYISLSNLIHPEIDVLYVFGGDEGGIRFNDIQMGINDKIVMIDSPDFILWSIVAIAITMYDRKMKLI